MTKEETIYEYLGKLGVLDAGYYLKRTTLETEYEKRLEDPTQPRVHAETHDDEYYHTVSDFDCTSWFEQAADEDIVALAKCGFGGDYASDVVAEYYSNNEYYPEIVAMFSYKRSGFECHVVEEQAVEWVKVHRPHLVRKTGNSGKYEVHVPGFNTPLEEL